VPIPTPRKGEKEADYIGRCHTALADEYEDQKRHAICMGAWRKKHGGKPPEGSSAGHHLSLFAVTQEITLRREMLDGVEHVVLPLVGLVEGCYQCATCPEPSFYPAREFGKNVGAWNGRPVTINHPVRDGQYVSAGSPDVWEGERIGTIFNARLVDRKLHLEAWVDPGAVERAGAMAAEVMMAAAGGDQVEVSTAAWIDEAPRFGVHGNRSYSSVHTNFQPDHVALLPLGTIGACSWEDGCGVRVATAHVDDEPACCEACAQGEPCACGHEDLDLAASPPPKRKAKAPAEDDDDDMMDDDDAAGDPADEDGTDEDGTDEDGTDDDDDEEEDQRAKKRRGSRKPPDDMSTARNREMALQIALEEDLGGFVLIADHDDEHVYFVSDGGNGLRRRSYKEDKDGTCMLGSDEQRVRPRVDFVVVNNQEDGEMSAEKTKEPVAEEQPSTIEQTQRELSATDRRVAELQAQVQHLTDKLKANAAPKTLEEYIAHAPEEVRDGLMHLHRGQAKRKLELVDSIKASPGCAWSEEELAAKPLEELERLEKLAGTSGQTDYSVQRREHSRLMPIVDDDDYAPLPTAQQIAEIKAVARRPAKSNGA